MIEDVDFEFPIIPASKSSLTKRKLICGVGVNDAEYKVSIVFEDKVKSCPYYSKWTSMLVRCYSTNYNPTYKDVTVCKEWHIFSTFRLWMETQDWEGKQLDKDIIIPNSKVYSPETCVFVSQRVNSLLLDCGKSRGKYKQGVHADRGKFKAKCSNGEGKQKHIGYFPTEQLAYEAYVTYKHALILKVSNEQEDERVKNGLLLHAQLLLDTLNEEF